METAGRSRCEGALPTVTVFNTPLLVADYATLGAEVVRLCDSGHPCAVDFVNTQIATMRRGDERFLALSNAIDLFAPDGMPLVWCMNRRGAGLRDRIYGPTFMREFLRAAPSRLRHYLLGGDAATGARLRERLLALNPGLQICGSYHGPCDAGGVLGGEGEDREVNGEIRRLSPDLIWVGLGTPKQYAWIARNKAALGRGVMLAVGFAFDVNAGTKADAPAWMQRGGLTWLFRLMREPARLGPRYLRYNARFLLYLLGDALRGR